jgi:hypothetical protein
MSLQPCGEGVAFAAGDTSFGLLRRDGSAVTLAAGPTSNMGGKLGEAFTVSESGTRLRFGLASGTNTPLLFDLEAGTLTDALASPSDLRQPSTNGLSITDWQNALRPTLNGKPLIPTCTEPHALAQSRRSMDMMVQG